MATRQIHITKEEAQQLLKHRLDAHQDEDRKENRQNIGTVIKNATWSSTS